MEETEKSGALGRGGLGILFFSFLLALTGFALGSYPELLSHACVNYADFFLKSMERWYSAPHF